MYTSILNSGEMEVHMSDEVSDVIAKKVNDQIASFNTRADAAMDAAVRELNERGKKAYDGIAEHAEQLETRVKWVLLGVGGLVLAAVLAGVFESDKEVNKSAIELQRDIIAAQKIVYDSEKSMDEATKVLKAKTDEMSKELQHVNETDAKLNAEQEELKKVTAQLDKARADYQAITAQHKKSPAQ
jgi:hypothetical protein